MTTNFRINQSNLHTDFKRLIDSPLTSLNAVVKLLTLTKRLFNKSSIKNNYNCWSKWVVRVLNEINFVVNQLHTTLERNYIACSTSSTSKGEGRLEPIIRGKQHKDKLRLGLPIRDRLRESSFAFGFYKQTLLVFELRIWRNSFESNPQITI